jgi:hypothetical protein
MMGTHWEQGEKDKKIPPPFKKKRKYSKPLMRVHTEPSRWLHETFAFRTVCHHF